MATKHAKEARSLLRYVKDKRREGCPVCKLPPDTLAQLRDAAAKKVSVTLQLDWLRHEIGVTITSEQINSHRGGRHEEVV